MCGGGSVCSAPGASEASEKLSGRSRAVKEEGLCTIQKSLGLRCFLLPTNLPRTPQPGGGASAQAQTPKLNSLFITSPTYLTSQLHPGHTPCSQESTLCTHPQIQRTRWEPLTELSWELVGLDWLLGELGRSSWRIQTPGLG